MSSTQDRVCVVLLAAGASRRMGRVKQRIGIHGEAMVRRAARAALDAEMRLVIVTGANGGVVAAELAGIPHRRVHNHDWAAGMGGSIARGVELVRRDVPAPGALVIALADQPLVDARTLRRLVEAHRQRPDQIIAAAHSATKGPPVLFPERDWAALMQLSGSRGARTLLDTEHSRVFGVELPEAAVDIDTPEDLALLLDHRLESANEREHRSMR